MKIRRDMKIKEVLEFDEEKVLNTLEMLSPNFERLRYPKLRRAMSGRVSVEQAAKVARVPLTEMLYVLNLTLGENEEVIANELSLLGKTDFEYREINLLSKPDELINVKDSDENVIFVDLMPFHEAHIDPMPAIAKGLVELKNPKDTLLLKHPFDPIPLREMYLRRFDLASWAEERNPREWFIYFYRCKVSTKAIAHPSLNNRIFKAVAGF